MPKPIPPTPLRVHRRSLTERPATALLVPLLFAAVACGSAPVRSAGVVAQPSVGSQVDFGVQMAKRGLWSEALFRFQQAEREEPSDFRVMNNLAVAYEANGEFDRALDYYQRALRVEPGNRDLRRNYARFVEFYQSFRPQPEEAGEGGESAAAVAAGEDEGEAAAPPEPPGPGPGIPEPQVPDRPGDEPGPEPPGPEPVPSQQPPPAAAGVGGVG